MKARVMEQLRSRDVAGGAATAALTKVEGKVNMKSKKCSLAPSRSAMLSTTTTTNTTSLSLNFSEEADNQQVGACLQRIQSLVPFTSKNKTLSNLDIITSAIFYIRDLQETLGLSEEYSSSVNTEDNLDLIPFPTTPSTTCMETGLPSESSSVSTKCSLDNSSSPSPSVPQLPATTTTSKSNSSSPPANVTNSEGDSLLSPFSTSSRQRNPLSVIPSPNTPSVSAANCPGYRISQKS